MIRRSVCFWLLVAAAGLFPAAALAHPVPSKAHLRTIDVNLRPNELCVHYRLAVDEWTVVFVDLPALLDGAELKALSKPSEFYDTFLRRMGALLADQLLVTLDDQSLTLRCVEQRYEVLDHLRCEYTFVADWSPAPGAEHRL